MIHETFAVNEIIYCLILRYSRDRITKSGWKNEYSTQAADDCLSFNNGAIPRDSSQTHLLSGVQV